MVTRLSGRRPGEHVRSPAVVVAVDELGEPQSFRRLCSSPARLDGLLSLRRAARYLRLLALEHSKARCKAVGPSTSAEQPGDGWIVTEKTQDVTKIRRAIISVSDKTGLADFAHALAAAGVAIYSTGGTRRFLVEQGLEVRDVADYTGFPEMMDGRVKTLHPKVFGGILWRRDNPDDKRRSKRTAWSRSTWSL